MARTIAPHNPRPTTDTGFFGKPYHFTWAKSKKIVLHKGDAKKCRRVHYWQDGDKA
jgi:hypothetical protein